MHRTQDVKRNASANESLDALRAAAADCQACPLCQNATQTVFGEGNASARIMLVGEQPGDAEDRQGKPFVGPAGKLLDQALSEVGIDRTAAYVTNAVKHFKWEPRGKRRIHKTPAQKEMEACFQWLEGEIAAVRPGVIICLGATAARVLLGPKARITHDRGQVHQLGNLPDVIATYHPSYLLRILDEQDRARLYTEFIADLALARPYLRGDT
jgi:DNA polymerase